MVTINAVGSAERIARAILRQHADAVVFARARDAEHAKRLTALGVTVAIPDTVEASLMLGGRVLHALGLPDDAIVRRVELSREAESAKLE